MFLVIQSSFFMPLLLIRIKKMTLQAYTINVGVFFLIATLGFTLFGFNYNLQLIAFSLMSILHFKNPFYVGRALLTLSFYAIIAIFLMYGAAYIYKDQTLLHSIEIFFYACGVLYTIEIMFGLLYKSFKDKYIDMFMLAFFFFPLHLLLLTAIMPNQIITIHILTLLVWGLDMFILTLGLVIANQYAFHVDRLQHVLASLNQQFKEVQVNEKNVLGHIRDYLYHDSMYNKQQTALDDYLTASAFKAVSSDDYINLIAYSARYRHKSCQVEVKHPLLHMQNAHYAALIQHIIDYCYKAFPLASLHLLVEPKIITLTLTSKESNKDLSTLASLLNGDSFIFDSSARFQLSAFTIQALLTETNSLIHVIHPYDEVTP